MNITLHNQSISDAPDKSRVAAQFVSIKVDPNIDTRSVDTDAQYKRTFKRRDESTADMGTWQGLVPRQYFDTFQCRQRHKGPFHISFARTFDGSALD